MTWTYLAVWHTRAHKFIVCRITDDLSGQAVNNRRRLSNDVDSDVVAVDDDDDDDDDKRRFKESTGQSINVDIFWISFLESVILKTCRVSSGDGFACSSHPPFSLFISFSYLFISLSSFLPSPQGFSHFWRKMDHGGIVTLSGNKML